MWMSAIYAQQETDLATPERHTIVPANGTSGRDGKVSKPTDGERSVHTILFYDVVDDYVDKRVPLRSEHLDLARQAHARGNLVLAGALAEPADGAVLVFRGDSADAAVAFAKADPYVKNGLVKSWRVRKWATVIGEE